MKQNNMVKALHALAEHDTLTGAAEAVGLSRVTLYAYLADHDFRQRLQQQRAVMAVQRAEALADARTAAIKAITDVMNDESAPPAARIMAAKAVLIQATEADTAADNILQKLDFDSRWT